MERKGETESGEPKKNQHEVATRVADPGEADRESGQVAVREPGKVVSRGSGKTRSRKPAHVRHKPQRPGGGEKTNRDGPETVAIDAERVTWDRSIVTDAPPLNTRNKPDAVAKTTKQPVRRPDPKSRKPNTSDSVKSKKPEDRILFAAGLADNKSFPVGAQQVVDINANLKKDIWFDYVPTPYFQYHPTRRLYFQFGIQFNSPQYTEAVTIFAKPGKDTTGVTGSQFVNDTNIVVRKLYYYNFPLTVYFSPLENLHLGAGIQYSNLRNGIAFQNNVVHYLGTGPSRDTTTFAKVVDLKDDKPAYQNLKHSEWRALFEVNYYWKRITLGVQYQQALDKYLHQPVPGSKGTDRNSSLNLYLRYNIWEKRVPVKN